MEIARRKVCLSLDTQQISFSQIFLVAFCNQNVNGSGLSRDSMLSRSPVPSAPCLILALPFPSPWWAPLEGDLPWHHE